MSTADKAWKIRRRLNDYLCRVNSRRARRLREGLAEFRKDFTDIAVVGGMIRDVALSGTNNFNSDIDLAIVAPSREVWRFAAHRNAVPNRFGGFSTMIGPVKFDFWALEDTWAAKAGHLPVNSFQDLTRATFFILDAAVYDLSNRQLYLHPNYIEHLETRTLDLNLIDNPSKRGNLVRAVRRILRENLQVGNELRAFIEVDLSQETFQFIIRKELELYGNSWAAPYLDSKHLLDALVDRKHRKPSLQAEFNFAS